MVVRKLKQVGQWLDDRLGISELIGPMATHLVPHDARWWYVFGSATLCAFLIQVVSGVALAFVYVPSSSQAYQSLQFITQHAMFGRFLRGLHYYGASAMVLMVGIHMAQVFLFGSYKYPREMNWATGVLLLGFTIVMGFTGQLLRWDQTAVWSVMVAAEQAGRVPVIGTALAHFILGGETVGGVTLSRFFAIHVFVMPALIFGFVGIHLMLVLRHGISEPPKLDRPVNPATYRKEYHALLKRSGRPFWPDAAWRDAVFAAVMVAAIFLLSAIVGPPHLGKPPNPSIVTASPRPDWYLLWYFALLALIPPKLESFVIVYIPLLAGAVLLLFPFLANRGDRSLRRRPWAVGVMLLIGITISTLSIEGVRSPWSPHFDPPPLPEQVVGATTGKVAQGAHLFHVKGCENCHTIAGRGGLRGPNLTTVGDRLTGAEMTIRILNGAQNMPGYNNTLKPDEVDDLVAFLKSRTSRHEHSQAAN